MKWQTEKASQECLNFMSFL